VKILVLGSGAREHASVLALKADAARHEVLAAPGNAGIGRDATLVDVDMMDPAAVTEFAKTHVVDLVVVGPEAPLVAGVADALRERGIPVFGPGKQAAQLEGSKAFAKRIMENAGVPTGRAVHARTIDETAAALDEFGAPYVVKADGLAAGKGVIVTESRDAALEHASAFLPSGPVLIEEFLSGPEVSLFFLSDGDTVRPLSPAQDFKRALDGDQGPNTGGMGAYSPLPWLTDQFGSVDAFVDEVTETVAKPVIAELDRDGSPFIGLLYAGLIITEQGVRVIELPRLQTPLAELLMAAADGTLEDQPRPVFGDDVAVTVVLASEGYPASAITGREITGLDEAAEIPGVHVTHAATALEGDKLIATGGRVLNVVGTGATFEIARSRAYEAISKIGLEGGQFRTDIAAKVA
jgi:phosphoribosylamine--glycine ligase